MDKLLVCCQFTLNLFVQCLFCEKEMSHTEVVFLSVICRCRIFSTQKTLHQGHNHPSAAPERAQLRSGYGDISAHLVLELLAVDGLATGSVALGEVTSLDTTSQHRETSVSNWG